MRRRQSSIKRSVVLDKFRITFALITLVAVQGFLVDEGGDAEEPPRFVENYSCGEVRYFAVGLDGEVSIINLVDGEFFQGGLQYRKLVSQEILQVDEKGVELCAVLMDVEIIPTIEGEPAELSLSYEQGLLEEEVHILVSPEGEVRRKSELPTIYDDLDGDALSFVFSLFPSLYPHCEVLMGESWEISQPLHYPVGEGNGFWGDIVGQATLKELTDEGWSASFEGALSGKILYQGTLLIMGGRMEGPLKGELHFHHQLGYLEKVVFEGDVSGNLEGLFILQPFHFAFKVELKLVVKRFYPRIDDWAGESGD